MKNITLIIVLSITSCFTFTKDTNFYNNTKEEKPIVVVIPSYNNKYFYKKNLDSVCKQNYNNYRIIYVNDASTDKTGELVKKYIKDKNQEHHVTYINNEKNKGALYNLYNAIHTCDNDTIIVTLDGDDWLKDENVLQVVNEAYQNKNVWMTYGQYKELYYSKSQNKFIIKPGHCKQIPPNIIRAQAYRQDSFVSSHLHTFYAGLFKKIKLEDLLYHGNFYDVTWDLAFMLPLLEMVNGNCKFIDETLYVYNCITPINDFKTKLQRQLYFGNVIRSKEKYEPQKSITRKIYIHEKADIIILSKNNPEQLYALLESIYCYMSGIGQIYVLYNASNEKYSYDKVKKYFYAINLISLADKHFKSTLENTMQTCSKYFMLSTDKMLVTDFVDIRKCVEIMDRTYAYGFYLNLGKNIQKNASLCRKQQVPPCVEINNGIYAWQFQDGEQDWKIPHKLSMAIYRKTDIINTVNQMQYDSSESLKKVWNNQIFNVNKVGLFFESSKATGIEPVSKEKLRDLCNKNMKINIVPLFLINNFSTIIKTDLATEAIS